MAAAAWRVGNSFQPEQLSDYSLLFFSFFPPALSTLLDITNKSKDALGSGLAMHEYRWVEEETLLSLYRPHSILHL